MTDRERFEVWFNKLDKKFWSMSLVDKLWQAWQERGRIADEKCSQCLERELGPFEMRVLCSDCDAPYILNLKSKERTLCPHCNPEQPEQLECICIFQDAIHRSCPIHGEQPEQQDEKEIERAMFQLDEYSIPRVKDGQTLTLGDRIYLLHEPGQPEQQGKDCLSCDEECNTCDKSKEINKELGIKQPTFAELAEGCPAKDDDSFCTLYTKRWCKEKNCAIWHFRR